MSTMNTRNFTARFNSPAFLGNADRNGQWRTPPFKHLLREWWRVAWVAAGGKPADWQAMRETEGRLFGHAWLENDHDAQGRKVGGRRSLVRLRLTPWAKGQLQSMPRTQPVSEGRNAAASHLYLGYGPVKSAKELEMAHPLDPNKDSATLALAWPVEESGAEYLEDALVLIHAFGTVGGRARNGWGSIALDYEGRPPALENLAHFVKPWRDCLAQEWAHAIGEDERGPLIWTTAARGEWKAVIEDLASIRKQTNALAKQERAREIVNQPVAGKGARVPSNLRFKVCRDENGQFYGLVFHMPFSPPKVNRRQAETLWPDIHALLDEQLQRSAL